MKSSLSPSSSAVEARRTIPVSPARVAPGDSVSDASTRGQTGTSVRRLIAGRQYFGVDALVLHAGAERMLARVASQRPQQRRIDLRSLAEDFCIVGAASSALLSELLKAGLLQPEGTGGYLPTALFKEYANACVVAPLSRERARALIERVSELALRINAKWTSNMYVILAVAVSGSYMSRRDPLDDLSLWLIMRARSERRAARGSVPLTKDYDVRQIGAAIKALSSFISVRVVSDRQHVHRPFVIVFQADENPAEDCVRSLGTWWERTVASIIGVRKQSRLRSSR